MSPAQLSATQMSAAQKSAAQKSEAQMSAAQLSAAQMSAARKSPAQMWRRKCRATLAIMYNLGGIPISEIKEKNVLEFSSCCV